MLNGLAAGTAQQESFRKKNNANMLIFCLLETMEKYDLRLYFYNILLLARYGRPTKLMYLLLSAWSPFFVALKFFLVLISLLLHSLSDYHCLTPLPSFNIHSNFRLDHFHRTFICSHSTAISSSEFIQYVIWAVYSIQIPSLTQPPSLQHPSILINCIISPAP